VRPPLDQTGDDTEEAQSEGDSAKPMSERAQSLSGRGLT
jgi:hypothetical protein